jgi:hypothetical protein
MQPLPCSPPAPGAALTLCRIWSIKMVQSPGTPLPPLGAAPGAAPTLCRIWLMKMMVQPMRAALPAILRSAALMRRACAPTMMAPMSPSSSDRGVRAATLSTAMTSAAPERASSSVTCRAGCGGGSRGGCWHSSLAQ